MPHHLRTRRLGRIAALLTTLALLVAGLAPAASAEASTVVTGRVTGDGLPLRHVAVAVVVVVDELGVDTYASAETGSDGTFRLVVPGSAPARAWIQYRAGGAVGGTSPTGYADRCAGGGPICVDDGHPTLRLDGTAHVARAALDRAGALRGRVTDSLGRGVGGLGVAATAEPFLGADRVSSTVTDVNGNYALPRLDPYRYTVGFGIQNALASSASPAADGYTATSVTFSLAAGQERVQDTTLVGGGAISGRVVDQTGAPFAGVRVTWYLFAPVNGFQATTTAANGTFSLHYLSATTAPLCADAGASTTCPPSTQGRPTTVREFETTTVRIVLRRAT